MKKLLLLSAIFILTAISCDKNEYEITSSPEYPFMRMWAMEACSSDFDYKEDSANKWGEKVLLILKNKDFNIKNHHLGFIKQKDFIGCGNCMRTGDYLDVEVPENQRQELKNIGFSVD